MIPVLDTEQNSKTFATADGSVNPTTTASIAATPLILPSTLLTLHWMLKTTKTTASGRRSAIIWTFENQGNSQAAKTQVYAHNQTFGCLIDI